MHLADLELEGVDHQRCEVNAMQRLRYVRQQPKGSYVLRTDELLQALPLLKELLLQSQEREYASCADGQRERREVLLRSSSLVCAGNMYVGELHVQHHHHAEEEHGQNPDERDLFPSA